MNKKNLVIFSILGAVISGFLFMGYTINSRDVVLVKNDSTNSIDLSTDNLDESIEVDRYWEATPFEDIKKSVLSYVDNMMESTVKNLKVFKENNDMDKTKLYEKEIARLNKIINNIKSAKTKEDLRQGIQVRLNDTL